MVRWKRKHVISIDVLLIDWLLVLHADVRRVEGNLARARVADSESIQQAAAPPSKDRHLERSH